MSLPSKGAIVTTVLILVAAIVVKKVVINGILGFKIPVIDS